MEIRFAALILTAHRVVPGYQPLPPGAGRPYAYLGRMLQGHVCPAHHPAHVVAYAPGAIDAESHSDAEAEECLDFRAMTFLTRCPSCAAPLWKEAVSTALLRRKFD